jgi:hypothetical protein
MAVIKEYEMKISVKDAKFNVEELNKSLDAQSDLVQELTDNVSDYERELDKLDKKDTNRIAQTKKLIEVTKRQLKEEKDGIKQIKTERIQANKVLKDATKNQADYSGVLGFVDKKLGGAISGIQGFTKGLMGATKGAQLLKIGLIATGLGAFVVLLGSLTAAFTRSEKGQEMMQKGLAAIGAITDVLLDRLAGLGEAIIEAVTSPVKAMKEFSAKFTVFMLDPWGGLKKAVTGAKDVLVEIVEETNKEIETIGKATKARIKAHHIERDLLTERAEADREVSELRLKAEDREKYSAAQRVSLLRKAQKIEEEITAKEIKAKQLLIDAQAIEIANGDTTIEAKDKLAQLQADLIKLDTKKLRSQRLLQTQITTALNEEKAAKEAAQKVIDDEIAAEEKRVADAILLEKQVETKRLEELKKIKDDFEAKVIEEQAITFVEQEQLKKDRALAELEELKATEEEKAAVIAYYDDKIKIAKKNDADFEKELDRDVLNAKLSSAASAFALVGSFAKEGGKLAKAMAIGQATVSGFQGVQNAFTTASASPVTAVFPAYPFIQAGLAGGFAAANIRKIATAQPSGGGPQPSSTTPRPPAPSTPSLPPSFNTVGASGTNQLADAIGSQTNQPIKTYVVARDVTTAQSLERNIITGATVG